MPRLRISTLVAVVVLFALGMAVSSDVPHLRAQTSEVPSVVTVGACLEFGPVAGPTAFRVAAIEGHWVSVVKGNTIMLKEGTWLNLDAMELIRPSRLCQ